MSTGFRIEKTTATQATERALLVESDNLDAPCWVPKAVVHDDSEVFDAKDNAEGTLVVEKWFARKQGWE